MNTSSKTNPTDLLSMFDTLSELNEMQRLSAKIRFKTLISEYWYRCLLFSIMFHVSRTTATVGGILLTALLSIELPSSAKWLTQGISLATTISVAILTLYKIEKRHFMLQVVRERFVTEAWQFITLSGRYSGHFISSSVEETGGVTHANQFAYYCTNIEKIRMQHIKDEFLRAATDAEDTNNGNKGVQQGNSGGNKGSPVTAVPDIPAKGAFLSAVEIPTPPHLVGKNENVIIHIDEPEQEPKTKNTKEKSSEPTTTVV